MANQYQNSSHSIKNKFDLKQQQLFSFVLFACGFFAVQRFTISPVEAAVCIVPFGLFVVQMIRKNYQTALTCLVLALFLSTDNGGAVYAETFSMLRYAIYSATISTLFYLSNYRVQRESVILGFILCFGIAFGSLTSAFDNIPTNGDSLKRDLIVIFVLSVFLLGRRSIKLDIHLLYIGSLGYLVGEVLNILFFYTDFTEYLSYNSLKSFVIYPFIYSILTKRNTALQMLLGVTTLYVILMYGTRMIVLSLFVLFGVMLIFNLVKGGDFKKLFGFLVVVIILASVNISEILLEFDLLKFKAIAFVADVQENFNTADILKVVALLDPVRFGEHQLFFERSIFEIIYGNGPGSGLYDANGVLGFVGLDQTAFSEKEINSSTFYNLHDFWIDFGLRFGLIPIIYVSFRVILQNMWQGSPFQGLLFGVVLINTTFSISGVLLLTLLIRFLPLEQQLLETRALIDHLRSPRIV